MRKLIYLLLLVSGSAFGQGGGSIKVNTPFDKGNPLDNTFNAYERNVNGADQHRLTLAGRDSISNFFTRLLKDGITCYVSANKSLYRWDAATTTWVNITNYTKAQVDSINATVIHKTGDEVKNGSFSLSNAGRFLGTYANTDYINFGVDSLAIDQSIFNFRYGDNVGSTTSDIVQFTEVTNTTTTPVLQFNTALFRYLGNDIIHAGRIGSGLSYSGGVLSATGGSAPTLQSVATAGNSYTGRLSTQGNDGTVYQNFINQTTLPTPVSGQVNLGFIGGSFAYRNILGQRTYRSAAAGDVTFYLPNYNASTTQKIANADSVNAQLALKLANTDTTVFVRKPGATMTGNLVTTYNGTPTHTLTNPVSGSSTAIAQSPTLNEFSITSNAYPNGGVGGAAEFTGSTSGLISGAGSVPLGALPFSMHAWAYRTGGNNAYIAAVGGTASANFAAFTTTAGNGLQVVHSGTTIGSSTTMLANQWYWLTYTFDGTQGRFYINAAIVAGAVTITTPNLTSGALYVARSPSATQLFTGLVDQLVTRNDVLTQAQITAIYNNKNGTPSLPVPANMLRRFDFETNAAIATDGITGASMSFPGGVTFNPNGKVSLAGGATLVGEKWFGHYDADANGSSAIAYLGTTQSETRAIGSFRVLGRNATALQVGANGYSTFGDLPNLQNTSGNYQTTAQVYLGSPNVTGASQLQFAAATTLPTYSLAREGGISYDGLDWKAITRGVIKTLAYADQVPTMANFTASGNGSATTITFAHGITGVTASTPFDVAPHSAAAGGFSYTTIDATNVSVVYTVAPVTGTNNLLYTLTIKP